MIDGTLTYLSVAAAKLGAKVSVISKVGGTLDILNGFRTSA
jgi:hypothetical protein